MNFPLLASNFHRRRFVNHYSILLEKTADKPSKKTIFATKWE